MKSIPLALALAVLSAAGSAAAGEVVVLNCNSPNGWINAYAYDSTDTVRIAAASDSLRLDPGKLAKLTCATETCTVKYEFPVSIANDLSSKIMANPALNYGLGDQGTNKTIIFDATRVCTYVTYGSDGRLTLNMNHARANCTC